jgi:hypothetical protein
MPMTVKEMVLAVATRRAFTEGEKPNGHGGFS